jgi:hypothetical protein
MASREMEHGSVGPSGVAEMEERPLREHKESRNGGSRGGPGGTRSGGLTNPNSSPRIAGPDSMSASGLRKMAKGKVSAPQVKRSTVVRRIASKDSPPGRAE